MIRNLPDEIKVKMAELQDMIFNELDIVGQQSAIATLLVMHDNRFYEDKSFLLAFAAVLPKIVKTEMEIKK